jgi:hypothetical protein
MSQQDKNRDDEASSSTKKTNHLPCGVPPFLSPNGENSCFYQFIRCKALNHIPTLRQVAYFEPN